MCRTLSLAITLAAVAACGSSTVITGSTGDEASGGGGQGGVSSSAMMTSAASGGLGGGGLGGGGTGQGGGGIPSAGPWRADMWVGQVDHLAIRHLDSDNDVCVLIGGTAPSQSPAYDVTIPSPWAIDMITVWDATDGCVDEAFTPSGPSVTAMAATGAIDFELAPMQFYPCELDVDVVVSFDSPPAWLPPSLTLSTTSLTVENACL